MLVCCPCDVNAPLSWMHYILQKTKKAPDMSEIQMNTARTLDMARGRNKCMHSTTTLVAKNTDTVWIIIFKQICIKLQYHFGVNYRAGSQRTHLTAGAAPCWA